MRIYIYGARFLSLASEDYGLIAVCSTRAAS